MRWRIVIVIGVAAAVLVVTAPYWSGHTAIVESGLIADRIIARSVIVAVAAESERSSENTDAGTTEVRAELEPRDAARVAGGLEVVLTTLGGRARIGRGVVTRVAAKDEPRAIGVVDASGAQEPAVRAAWIAWDGAPSHPSVGQEIEAVIMLPAVRAVRVPRRAVVIRDGDTVVDARWALWSYEIPVEVGAADDTFAEVRGVSPGTRVYLH